MVVAVGFTTRLPLTGTGVPFKSPVVAFFDVQVRVAEFPATIEAVFDEIPAATGPDAPTVTVVEFDTVAPDADVATSV